MEYSNSQIRDLIAEYVHSLRDRQILCQRLINGATIDELAGEFDLSVSQVKRILRKNEEALFRHLPSDPKVT